MKNFNNIQQKLQQFIKKYYTNELIKGLILFASFGLLYFLITVFIEYFLWLPPTARSVLFFVFIAVELGLLIKFIAIPLAKLFGLQKGISLSDASSIIGKHFPEVDDKLLNVLQLNQNKDQSELLLASIEQKSASLQPIPFKKAVNFKGNVKYLKYLSIPLLIWAFTALSGNNSIFNDSFNRVVDYKTAYEPPAPFAFIVLNDKLQNIEGQPFELIVATEGKVVPENVTIHFNNESYMLKDINGNFSHQFNNLKEPIEFYLEANNVRSKPYQLEVLETPNVTGFEMYMNYPAYTGKKDELIKNTGNAVIPEGSTITWNITTKATDSMKFVSGKSDAFTLKSDNNFSISKRVHNDLNYQITTSNKNLKNYEKLNYAIQVIKDEHPKIEVKSDIDSISRGPVQFVGQLSDDYGLKKLQLVYYSENDEKSAKKVAIDINKSTFEEFYYIFSPEMLKIESGKTYNMYFEVYDNDGANGSKVTKSQVFSYYNKTKQEITDDLLKEQKQNLEELNKTNKDSEKLNKDLDEFSKKLKKKSDLNWNDKKEFDQFLKRQEQYKQMQEKHTENLKENLDEQEQNDENQTIKDRKEELKKRIEEAQELQEKNDLLEQLKKMSEKLEKEQMLDKLDKLTEQNKQEKKTLERLLEMSKRFFVEKKAAQITKKLDSLSKKQEEQSENENSKPEDQENLNKDFEEIKKDFEELRKQNKNLAQPMKFPETKNEEKAIEEEMKKAEEDLKEAEEESKNSEKSNEEKNLLKEEKKKSAAKKQKSAAKKQNELSKKMGGAMMEMQGEMLQENIDDLKSILENLLTFSFDQEQLLMSFDGIDASHAEFPKKLKKQQIIKENFEHIDDSLYTLSLRVPQLTSKIQEDLTNAHYNLDKSLEHIAENQIQSGRSNQQYTMTAANNLADMLSDMLNNMQNSSSGEGKCKGSGNGLGNSSGGDGFRLPDIIKKQGELKKKMEEGMKKGEGEPKEVEDCKKGKEQMSGEQYQIYQEQNALKEALKEMMGKEGKGGSQGQKAIKQMEALEKQLLDKGFNRSVLRKMQQLEHELLKLEDAQLEQGKDNKRKSETNVKTFEKKTIPKIKGEKLFFNKDEILNREPLPLRNNYKKKVQQYFKEPVKE
ncbi:DUF4175 family protein [Aureibaculum sp. 2210JD6-5]|uniref:DUF4175 family protein n=1 Tax=Aureibaculum sp. 2210JD6-5 TaxID=3103957 RepID=UPI002AACB577|nr:DUF4175 family protein [Aureibaculum sp. 2210JD6-5]MDY7394681.1 DUF4175 family protein [Aureibaculum sp. 2210JD6-5]